VVSDGRDVLFVVNADISGSGSVSELIYLDVADGAEIRRLDLSEWWVDLNDGLLGGQYCGGPTELFLRRDLLAMGSHGSCVNMLMDPYAENQAESVKWVNQNGDYIGDRNFEPGSQKQWVCNDHYSGPYKYNVTLDDNLFTLFPIYDMGAVSFGLFAPDGTGIGYLALAGETARQKYGVELIDSDSPYDGLYTTNNTGAGAASGQIDATFWYVGCDSVKGVIAERVAVHEPKPGSFAVSQNIPNPFNPSTAILFSLTRPGKVRIDIFNGAGQKVDTLLNANLGAGPHSAVWNASRFSSGVYYYTVTAEGFSRTMRMTLRK
jgi:hypothetical protein